MPENKSEHIPQTASEVKKVLSDLRSKRGYLLPHHGLMAVSSPDLLTAYDRTYSELTLKTRVMDDYQKELVWLIILVSTGEAIATHHIDRLKQAGGSVLDVEAALAFAAWADGAQRHSFVAKNWGPHLPGFDPLVSYRRGLEALIGQFKLERWIVEIGLAAAHQCHRRWSWVGEHIIAAYDKGAVEGAIAEGLSLAMFPGGVPNFVDACDVWRKLILAGKVSASAPYLAWAQMSGQGGFDDTLESE